MAKKIETVRVNLNIPKQLLADLDEYAYELNINRTAALTMLLSQGIKGNKIIQTVIDQKHANANFEQASF